MSLSSSTKINRNRYKAARSTREDIAQRLSQGGKKKAEIVDPLSGRLRLRVGAYLVSSRRWCICAPHAMHRASSTSLSSSSSSSSSFVGSALITSRLTLTLSCRGLSSGWRSHDRPWHRKHAAGSGRQHPHPGHPEPLTWHAWRVASIHAHIRISSARHVHWHHG